MAFANLRVLWIASTDTFNSQIQIKSQKEIFEPFENVGGVTAHST